MREAFHCPSCGQAVEGAAELTGQRVRCAQCNAEFGIPTPDADTGTVNLPIPGGPSGRPYRFTFVCPRCAAILEAAADRAGGTGRCSICGGVLHIPDADPRTGLAQGAARPLDEEVPTGPLHAFAADSAQAPTIARQADGSQVIVCRQCGARCAPDADRCSACGAPFTLEGADALIRSTAPRLPLGALSILLGITGLLPTCAVFASPAAVVLGLLGLRRRHSRGRRRDLASVVGASLGAAGILIVLIRLLT
jgi:DNA-directed RNA polymerase subunit M/transcription elongation factor TFIIS